MLESEECVERVACNINNLIEEIRLNSRFEPGADTEGPCLTRLLAQGKSHIYLSKFALAKYLAYAFF